MLRLPTPLIFGTFLKRYKRFFVDVLLDDGTEVVAHCPNPGAMLGVLESGNRVALTHNNNPARKLSYTWQLVEAEGTWIGVNTHLTNKIVAAALEQKLISEVSEYSVTQREVKYGTNSRIDFLLTGEELPPCYLEVKNVHLKRNNVAQFPDCVTERGAKHMSELASMRQQGMRCVVLYVVQRNDVKEFSLAADIDPAYAKASEFAKASGVEMLAFACKIDIEREKNTVSFSLSHKLSLSS
jgi:sugar fermentation stimulation protein A